MYKVCLVDDEKLELNLLKNHVNWERLGVKEVFTAGNGQKALELVRAHNPDIVFTDIRMPVMDGIEFAKRLRELERVGGMHRSPVKVIFLTGYDDMELIRKAFRLAASDYILKPFLVEDIEKAAGEIINSLNQENISSQRFGWEMPCFMRKKTGGCLPGGCHLSKEKRNSARRSTGISDFCAGI